HPRYRVEGRDLHVDLPLAPWEAALGTSVVVDTPGGETKVKVPAGTSSGRRLRLRGRRLPPHRGRPGDLLAQAKVMGPGALPARGSVSSSSSWPRPPRSMPGGNRELRPRPAGAAGPRGVRARDGHAPRPDPQAGRARPGRGRPRRGRTALVPAQPARGRGPASAPPRP